VTTCTQLWDSDQVMVGQHPVPGSFFALACATTSAIVLKWFRDLAASGESYEELIEEALAVAPGSDGLTVLPHFEGTGTPSFNPDARGAIVGLTLGHSRAHIRAGYNGIVRLPV